MKKSTASAALLSVAPLASRTSCPVPFCFPAVEPVLQLVVAMVSFAAAGMVPEPPAGSAPKRFAPAPDPKFSAQLAISPNVSE